MKNVNKYKKYKKDPTDQVCQGKVRRKDTPL